MGRIEKTVFISYRRTNVSWALSIYQDLTAHGYDVFFDYQSIDSGSFEKVIIENIKARAHFLVILTPSALERCKNPNDWLRKEIETAIDERRNIVPLMLESFEFGTPLVEQNLTGKLSQLRNYNGLRVYSDYFFEGMEKLRHRFLSISLSDIQLQPLSTTTQEITTAQKEAASEVSKIEVEQLKESDANIRREEILKLTFQANTDRLEQERMRIARDLHDNVINQLAVLRNTLGDMVLPPRFQKEYDLMKNRLRDLLFDLRPPVLILGLSFGVEELVSILKEKNQAGPELETTIINEGNYRYPDNIENHIFFIIQEACVNAITHSNAKKITLKLKLEKERVEFLIADNGVGFDFKFEDGLNGLIENQRFGMAGMFERATIIDAKLEILTAINKGTKINLIWTSV